MSTVIDRLNPKLRRVMEILAEQPDGTMRKDDLWARIVSQFPLDEHEQVVSKSGTTRGETNFQFYSVGLVKAGWLFKSGAGVWRITDAGRAALNDFPDAASFGEERERLYLEWIAHRKVGDPSSDDPDSVSSQLLPPSRDAGNRRVLEGLMRKGLTTGGSSFAPGRHTWSREVVQDLYERYNLRPDEGSGSFLQKLETQLAGAPDDTILLAAELMTVTTLPLSNLSGGAKRDRINTPLALLSKPVVIPPAVDAVTGEGSWNGGVGLNVGAWKALAHVVEFLRYWWSLTADERQEATEDPWLWLQVVHSGPSLMPAQGEALLYHLFPTHFLPIISLAHKKRIREAFVEQLAQPTGDLDRDLFAITVALQVEAHGPIQYYQPPLVNRWMASPSIATDRQAWLVRGSAVNGQNLVGDWLAEGWASLWLRQLDPLPAGAPLAEVRAAVDAGYPGRTSAYRQQKAEDAHEFLSLMRVGDLLLTTSEGGLYIGEVTGEPTWTDDPTLPARLRRAVAWRNHGAPVLYEELPPPLPDRLTSQEDVTDLTDALLTIETLLDAAIGVSKTGAEEPVVDLQNVALPTPTADLADSLLVPLHWLQRFTRVLGDRHQVILYGPPGTGKTYLATKVARFLTNNPGDARLVQFHPSYSYEDFFEGYRPVKGADGQVGFELKAGPFRRIVEAARDNPTTPYVLIIDEINRANLAKVFGELYFLLEYRDQAIDLLYAEEGTEQFRLPRNVFVIGTMNTADRSIALVDAAMRRRFGFLSLHPDEPHVKGMLRAWLTRHDLTDEPAQLLEELNHQIVDADFRVGPSYLMRESVYERDDGIDEVWETSILPLLAEHHVGDGTDVAARYGLAALRRRIAAASPVVDVEGPTPEPASSDDIDEGPADV